MKILLDKYPKGTYKGQRTDGKYIDGLLYENLDVLSKKIVDDMTFFAIGFASTLEVGTGKTVMFTQIGEAWTELMKKNHNIDVPFTAETNIVWNPKDLIKRAFEVPKYSMILLDEWEDNHYWSDLGISLRQFFRKCRQLNLFICAIIPNFFQMPISYAISRSVFAIDVKFQDGFERGYFDFYSFEKKKVLYLRGKKEYNYFNGKLADFSGKFLDGYGVNEAEYRKAKALDLARYEDNKDSRAPDVVERETKIKLFKQLHQKLEKVTLKQLYQAFGIVETTAYNWLKNENVSDEGTGSLTNHLPHTYSSNPIVVKEINWEGGEEPDE